MCVCEQRDDVCTCVQCHAHAPNPSAKDIIRKLYPRLYHVCISQRGSTGSWFPDHKSVGAHHSLFVMVGVQFGLCLNHPEDESNDTGDVCVHLAAT